MQFANNRSNRHIFTPQDSGSPKDGLFTHISSLGPLARLDFERFHVAGDVIFKVEGDSFPTSQEDEEARIGSLAYAIKKLGNEVDGAEFVRCLNTICDDGDARSRQTIGSHYYREIADRGANVVLKEMALLAIQLESPVVIEREEEVITYSPETHSPHDIPEVPRESCDKPDISLFDQELASVIRMISGNRRATALQPDEFENFLDQMISDGFEGEYLASRVESFENLMQYDESGAIIVMSAHERTIACGRLDSEFTAEDLPVEAQHLAAELRRSFANGRSIDEIRDDINIQLEIIFPIVINLDLPKDLFPTNLTNGRDERISIHRQPRFVSHANRELQSFCREVLEIVLSDCQSDFHMMALRTNKVYREFHKAVRSATDTKALGDTMKKAYTARQMGALTLKHFTALTTAAKLQRVRLEKAHPSHETHALLKEIKIASAAKLRYLAWAMYGNNQPEHPIHNIPSNEKTLVWSVLKSRRRPARPSFETKDGMPSFASL